MIEQELKNRLADFFESWELVELLRLPVEDIVEAFEDEIEDRLDDILEVLGVNDGESALLDRESEE